MATPETLVKPGDVLAGKYRVERVLGIGGMGVVVAARHLELRKSVALKMLLPDALSDRETVERFSREARAASRLSSEHTVRVTDVGRLKNGAPFMVMELLVGRDLGQLIEEGGPLAPAVATDYILQACEAIAEAHAIQIVHRDIKPRNLFLAARPDGRALIKVLDFGIAKAGDKSADVALTQTSGIMGSPQYMSPEQMRASRDVDGRTDIWSLGVCLYELIVGMPPFDGASVAELCASVLTGTPESPAIYRPDLPAGLAAAIMRCLEKDRERRFANVGELAAAIQPFAPNAVGAAERVSRVLTTTQRQFSDHPPATGDSPNVRTVSSWGSRSEPGARKFFTPFTGFMVLLSIGFAITNVLLAGALGHLGGKKPTFAATSETSSAVPATAISVSNPAAILPEPDDAGAAALPSPASASAVRPLASSRPAPAIAPPIVAVPRPSTPGKRRDAGANPAANF